ncbi:MAG: hypothetical protein V4547_16900 [Bacteroidota bacterium]
MRYAAINSASGYSYPDHNVPASQKNSEWCMKYAQAAYYDFTVAFPKGVFYSNGGDYEKFRMYAMGKQPVNQYKSMLGVDMTTLNTQLVVDWTVRAVVSGYRDKAIARCMKEDYSVVCTPVDSQSKTETDKYYAELRTKLIMRDILQEQNSELATHPFVQLQSNEPMDMEELEMRIQNGEQFNRSMDAEMAIELGFYENNYKSFRRAVYEDLFDFGVAGYREWLGEDNKAKFERLNPESIICSYAKDGTFSDMVHAGSVIDVQLVDLALVTDEEGNPMFDDKTLQEFAGSIAGKFGNPATMNMGRMTGFLKPYDKFKCKVLDMYFYTYNEQTYTDRTDANGNPVFKMEVSGRGELTNTRYKRKKVKYVYKCKWIIGTDKCYDWGMCYDQKRTVDLKKKALTRLPIQLIAYNFYEMRAQGFMERLIPYIDDYQLTILKIQNWKNRSVPSGWWINMDMLENVAKNKGGKNMTPKEVLQMFFDSGIIIGRMLDDAGNPLPGNIQPVIAMQNSVMAELVGFFQDLQNTVMTIEKMTGYNDITSGNPNPKTLVPGYEIANQATNDALYPLAFAEENLSIRLAEDVYCRMAQGVKKGKVNGYAPYKGALGTNTLRFIELSPDMALRDYGIELQKQSTEQEKNWIFQMVQADIAQGFLDTSDAISVIYAHNAKQAVSILAYRVKKAKELAQKNQLQLIQANNQGSQQAAQVAAQLTAAQKQMDYDHAQQMEKIIADKEITIASMKIESAERIALNQSEAKVAVGETTGQAKIVSTHLAGESAKQKQEIANEKKETASV